MIFYGLLFNEFIIRAKYPFNTDTIIGYAVVFISQTVLISHGLLSVIVVELFCCQVISQLSLHFQLLNMDFATIGTELLVHGPQSQKKMVVSRIRQLLLRHQYLLELGNQVKELLKPNIIGQFVASIIMICTSAFEVLVAKGNVMLIIRFGAFVLAAFFQIFMWSLFGELVAQKSLGICDGIASCIWIVLDSRQKKDLSFIMMRSQKPFIINVYRMFPLTFDTFLAILSRSYSIFTILRETIE
uniref:Uncharacterized protein n=2 Tax=Anopheles albimanus TaxID=7167 RepID=A0A182FC62_ANOAL